jgi:mannosyltransferase
MKSVSQRLFSIPTLLFLVYFVVRFFEIGTNSLAGDEPFSVYFAQIPLADILRHLKPGNNPPLYELLLHFWIKLFGISEIAVRIPSLLFSAATATLLYKIAADFFKKEAGFLAFGIFLFNNYATYFSHEARVYALFGLLTAASFYFFLKILNEQDKWTNIIIYGVINALVLYAHYFGIMVLGIEVLCFLVLKPITKQSLGKFAVALGIMLLLFAPYLPVVYTQFIKTKTDGTWLQAPQGWPTMEYMFIQFSNTKTLARICVALIAFATLLWFWKWKNTSANTKVIWLWFILPFFGMFIVSYWVPMFHNRYLMHAFVGYSLLLSVAAFRVLPLPVAKYLIPIALLGSFFYKSDANVDNARHTKDAVAKVQELRDDNTRIVMYPKYRMFGYAYYFNKERFKNYDKEYGYYNVIEGFQEENLYAINQYSEARIDSFCCDKLIFIMTDAGPKEQLLADFEKEFVLLNTYHYPEIIDVYEYKRKESVLID